MSSFRHYPIHVAGPSLYSWANMDSSPLTLDAILRAARAVVSVNGNEYANWVMSSTFCTTCVVCAVLSDLLPVEPGFPKCCSMGCVLSYYKSFFIFSHDRLTDFFGWRRPMSVMS